MSSLYVVLGLIGIQPHIVAVGDERILEKSMEEAREDYEYAWFEQWKDGRAIYVSPIYEHTGGMQHASP